jgi:two-component system sensor histidine kinase AlgZ
VYPLLATPTRAALYVAAWVPVGLGLAAVLYLIQPRPGWTLALFLGPLLLMFASTLTSPWWLLRGQRSARPLDPALVAKLAVAAVATAGLWAIAGAVMYEFIETMLPPTINLEVRRKDVVILFLTGLGLYWLSAALHMAFLVSLRAVEAERRALESQVSTREAELRALRSQLNPHFLFNSLNSIMSLVGRSPEEARRMCQGLGDFLRRTLNLGARERVTLDEELELIRHYLDIESVRFGDRLGYRVDVPMALGRALVPPLLLQPLIENAVKHGVAARLDGGRIRLEAREEAAGLHLIVKNPVDEEAVATPGEGVGLDNVRRRLRALGEGRSSLEVRSGDGEFEVHLLLPLVLAEEES